MDKNPYIFLIALPPLLVLAAFLYIFPHIKKREEKEKKKDEQIEQNKKEYGDAVNYFYNNAFFDEKGASIATEIMGDVTKRKYFTLYELNDLKKKYMEESRKQKNYNLTTPHIK